MLKDHSMDRCRHFFAQHFTVKNHKGQEDCKGEAVKLNRGPLRFCFKTILPDSSGTCAIRKIPGSANISKGAIAQPVSPPHAQGLHYRHEHETQPSWKQWPRYVITTKKKLYITMLLKEMDREMRFHARFTSHSTYASLF